MSNSAIPPDAADRGALLLVAALQPDAAPLRPDERAALLALLAAVEQADQLVQQTADDEYAYFTGLLFALLDGHRRALAGLGAR